MVRKDLTNQVKEGANVPTYVLEYLLGMYCATDDEDSVRDGMERVKIFLPIISYVRMKLKKSKRKSVRQALIPLLIKWRRGLILTMTIMSAYFLI